ncbi:MAG: hypothetical protein ACRD1L_09680 [Terriglobales bacterium]
MPRIIMTLMGPNGASPSQDITGITQSVIVGLQVQLEAQYQMPSGDSSDSLSWTIPGTTASSWTPGSPPSAVSTTGALTTVYWTAPDDSNDNNVEFDLQYTDSSGQSQQSLAETNVNAAGPSGAAVSVILARWDIDGNFLSFGDGNPPGNIGISFAASASPPAGISNYFTWLQLITSAAGTCKIGGTEYQVPLPSTTPSLLDNKYPYATGSTTNDNPGLILFQNATDETYSIGATMYVLWSPAGPSGAMLSGAIPIPLGSVSWSAYGHANGSPLAIQSDSTQADGGFSSSSAYPTWSQKLVNGKATCGPASGSDTFGRPGSIPVLRLLPGPAAWRDSHPGRLRAAAGAAMGRRADWRRREDWGRP